MVMGMESGKGKRQRERKNCREWRRAWKLEGGIGRGRIVGSGEGNGNWKEGEEKEES